MSEQATAQPRVRTSAQTDQFDEAFAKAQAKFEAAVKANVNPAFRSKYADVSSVIDATLEHLNSEGIGVKQHPGLEYRTTGAAEDVEAFMTVTTRLTYRGQWEESDLSIPAVQRDRFDAQSCGSALTYACRYALQGIFVVRREDDDANAATGRGTSEASAAVADKKAKGAKERADSRKSVDCLFYSLPEAHNGHFAEFLNLKAFGENQNEVAQEGLRQILKEHGVKGTAAGGGLVASEKLDALVKDLSDAGVLVKQLEGA